MKKRLLLLLILTLSLLSLCACQNPPNNPHGRVPKNTVVYYSSFTQQPKTLDPARAYSTNEAVFVGQTYEPPLQYHYLLRPYTLIPLTAQKVPQPVYLDKQGHVLPDSAPAETIAYSVYNISIKPGIYYQPHPAFAKDSAGNYYYFHLTPADLRRVFSLNAFAHTGTRELTAADYVYEIKRLADPKVQSPIYGLMSGYILGLSDYAKVLQKARDSLVKSGSKSTYLNLNKYDFAGAKVLGRYDYRIVIKGKYPQFMFWLAMTFFAPVPWEADYFYSQPGMAARNFTFDWYPVGTGAYQLAENNPNSRIVLLRNPNFHSEYFPSQGEMSDKNEGFLAFAGQRLPFIDEYIFSLERESIPRWNKFLQGYYDQSGISSDNFDQTIHIDVNGNPVLSPMMLEKDINLRITVGNSLFYTGFNMLDDVVGGYSERARKLRQAISIAINQEEFIAIFLNGRGIPAQGPIPPGIFGFQAGKAGINPYVYDWVSGRPKRKSIESAKKLLVEAGYPGGRDRKTGEQLILNFDVTASGGPDDKAEFEWFRKQFAKLGIQLQIRATQYNRFQELMRTGHAQIYMWGWNADYPDPENFLFLLYGPNAKVKHGGENASNYHNAEFDKLYSVMKNTPNNPQRQAVIEKMVAIVQRDAPWVFGFFPRDYILAHQWVGPIKPSGVINNSLKYNSLKPQLRLIKQREWNRPLLWPLSIILLLLIAVTLPVVIQYWRKEHMSVKKVPKC